MGTCAERRELSLTLRLTASCGGDGVSISPSYGPGGAIPIGSQDQVDVVGVFGPLQYILNNILQFYVGIGNDSIIIYPPDPVIFFSPYQVLNHI